jgi:hypothetical protein
MAGQLSPDGNYYWDGTRWTSAASPDGAWRWDGHGWQPAAAPRKTGGGLGRPLTVVIAVAVVAAVGIAGLGLWGAAKLITREQQALQSSMSAGCAQNAMPGKDVAEGDSLCGRRLGPSITSADCTSGATLPSDLTAEHIPPAATDWTPADVAMDAGGCELLAQHKEIVAIDSTGEETPDITLVADFVPVDYVGAIGLRLACTDKPAASTSRCTRTTRTNSMKVIRTATGRR